MDKTAKDLEDATRRNNHNVVYRYVNKLRKISQSRPVPVKDRSEATVSNKARVKETWVNYFENMVNRDRVIGKDIDENENLWHLGSEERYMLRRRISDNTKRIKKNKASGAANIVIELFFLICWLWG